MVLRLEALLSLPQLTFVIFEIPHRKGSGVAKQFSGFPIRDSHSINKLLNAWAATKLKHHLRSALLNQDAFYKSVIATRNELFARNLFAGGFQRAVMYPYAPEIFCGRVFTFRSLCSFSRPRQQCCRKVSKVTNYFSYPFFICCAACRPKNSSAPLEAPSGWYART